MQDDQNDAPEKGGVRIEDGMAVIRIPISELHGLCVALEPCPCKSPKSNSTARIRARLSKGLHYLLGQAGMRGVGR